MNNIKVSIIVPAYNAEKYIERCLNCLIIQTLKDIEIIVINDGSTDNTEKICLQYQNLDSRIKTFSKINEGQGVARNLGILKAQGEYLGFVDADDYVDSNMYQEMYAQALNTAADMVYSYTDGESYINIKGAKQIENGILLDNCDLITNMKKMWLGGLPIEKDDCQLGMSVWRSLFRTDIIKKKELKFVSERIVNSEDLLFNLKFIEYSSRIATLNAAHYHYCNDNPMSFSVRPNQKRFSMFSELYKRTLALCTDAEEELRCARRYLANTRVVMVEKAHWCSIKTYHRSRKEILEILNDPMLSHLLNNYPINDLPFMQAIYFKLMKLKFPCLLIIIAKLRYRLL